MSSGAKTELPNVTELSLREQQSYIRQVGVKCSLKNKLAMFLYAVSGAYLDRCVHLSVCVCQCRHREVMAWSFPSSPRCVRTSASPPLSDSAPCDPAGPHLPTEHAQRRKSAVTLQGNQQAPSPASK